MRRTNGLALAFFVAAGVAGAALGVMGDRWLVRERLERQWQDPRAMRARLADDLGMDEAQRAALYAGAGGAAGGLLLGWLIGRWRRRT